MTTQERINAAMLLSTDKQYAAALAVLEPAYADDPNNFPVAGLMGTALANLGRYDEARKIWGALLVAQPMNPLTWLNLGTTYQEEFRLNDSDYCFYRALELKPPFSNMLMYGLGSNRLRSGKYAEALTFYEALPDDPRAVNSCGVLRMKLGEFARGAKETERRLDYTNNFWPSNSIPKWDGKQIPADTVTLLVNDQGVGDCIFYTRIARDFMTYNQTKLYIADEGLAELMRYLYPEFHIDSGSIAPTADVQMALGSLPAYYAATGWTTLPEPYPQREWNLTGTETWLTFRGSKENSIDGCRSLNLTDAGNLFDLLAKSKIAQADLTEAERCYFRNQHVGEPVKFTPSWVETAELMRKRCKLLITVDTAMAHLANALGIPAIVLVSFAADWRWDIPNLWSNSRLIRQKTPGRWDDVFDEVVEAAREMNENPGVCLTSMSHPEGLIEGLADSIRSGKLKSTAREAIQTA